jgi:three-Cys-motif partner protein
MKKRPHLKTAYIDAFAGTGYRTEKTREQMEGPMFPEFSDEGTSEFLDGSARIALQLQPRLNKYIFIEKDENRFIELQKLYAEFRHLQDDIILVQDDSNLYLQDLCRNRNWGKHRAVLFLDPFGMQVEWNTIDAIAGTKAIDLWILFPLGVAVNRLLRKDGQINLAWQERLNIMFGSDDWYDAFYQTKVTKD